MKTSGYYDSLYPGSAYMRKYVCLALVFLTCFTLSAQNESGENRIFPVYTVPESEFDITINEKDGIKSVTITGYHGTANALHIPERINGLPVTVIGERAFEYKSTVYKETNSLTSITLPEGLLEIQDYAFTNNYLSSIIIPSSVRVIGDYAFHGNNLESAYIRGCRTIGKKAFSYNKLVKLVLPEGLTLIGEEAFMGRELQFQYGNTFLFKGESQNTITELILPPGPLNIGKRAFFDNRIEKLVFQSGPVEIGYQAFAYNKITEALMPESLTIGDGAFVEAGRKDSPILFFEYYDKNNRKAGLYTVQDGQWHYDSR
jgi:hypothetical protein